MPIPPAKPVSNLRIFVLVHLLNSCPVPSITIGRINKMIIHRLNNPINKSRIIDNKYPKAIPVHLAQRGNFFPL